MRQEKQCLNDKHIEKTSIFGQSFFFWDEPVPSPFKYNASCLYVTLCIIMTSLLNIFYLSYSHVVLKFEGWGRCQGHHCASAVWISVGKRIWIVDLNQDRCWPNLKKKISKELKHRALTCIIQSLSSDTLFYVSKCRRSSGARTTTNVIFVFSNLWHSNTEADVGLN